MIFVDTSAWIAVIDKADQYHLKASEYFKQKTKEGTRWITSDYILDETITRLRYNVGHRKAVEAIHRFDRAETLKLLRLIKIDDHLRKEAKRFLSDTTTNSFPSLIAPALYFARGKTSRKFLLSTVSFKS
jgi:predicted nucleic acid-binding protein